MIRSELWLPCTYLTLRGTAGRTRSAGCCLARREGAYVFETRLIVMEEMVTVTEMFGDDGDCWVGGSDQYDAYEMEHPRIKAHVLKILKIWQWIASIRNSFEDRTSNRCTTFTILLVRLSGCTLGNFSM